jgi:eukaryotic-like serine/threonine-protein kinase
VPGPETQVDSARRIGRYLVSAPIASGGMATVHFGALVGEAGFSRTVAVKKLHTGRRSRELIHSLLDEARLVSRVKHPNVVPILDVVADGREVLVVLEYVVGETLSSLQRSAERNEESVPLELAVSVVSAALHGLHAAHDAHNVGGEPLNIVHRDVSPQNIMVGADGLVRVLDFGIAKATERLSQSMAGQIKGKLAYMAPEQIRGETDRRSDIYAAAVVLWELLAGRRLFSGDSPGELLRAKIAHEIEAPSVYRAEVSAELDALVLRGLAQRADGRYATARDFAVALEDCTPAARATTVGAWVQRLAGHKLAKRAAVVADLERAAAALTGDAPGFSVGSLGSEPGGAFTEEVVSSDEPPSVPATERAERQPHLAPGDTATALRSEDTAAQRTELTHTALSGPPDPNVTALSAGSRAASATALSVGSTPQPGQGPTDGAGDAPPASVPASMPEPRDGPTTEGMHTDVSERPAARWGASLLMVLLGAALALWWFRPRAAAETDGVASPIVPTAAISAATGSPSAESSSATTPASASAPSAAASTSASASTSATAGPASAPPNVWPPAPTGVATSWPPASSAPPPPPPPPPAGDPCDPPYVVDDRGVRRLKPECM